MASFAEYWCKTCKKSWVFPNQPEAVLCPDCKTELLKTALVMVFTKNTIKLDI